MNGEKASVNFSLYPLFWLAANFAAGTLAGKYLETDWKISLVFCLLSAGLAACFVKRKFGVLFIFLAFIAAGAFCFQLKNQTIPADRIKRIYDESRLKSGEPVELMPQNAYIRRLQHQLIESHSLSSSSIGTEPRRRIRISRD